MDGEWCEEDTSPVVSMLIRQGTVELVDPKVRNIHEESGRNPTAPEDHGLECLWVPPAEREHAISLEQIREWGRTFSKNIPSGRNSFRSVDNSPCLKAGDSWFIQQPLRELSLTRCPTGVRDSDVSHPI